MNPNIVQQIQTSESFFPEEWSRQARNNDLPIREQSSTSEQLALHKTISPPLLAFIQNGHSTDSLSEKVQNELLEYCPYIQSVLSSMLKSADEENILLALKTFLHTLEDMVSQAQANEEDKKQALILINRYFDHLEWAMLTHLKNQETNHSHSATDSKENPETPDNKHSLDSKPLNESDWEASEKLFWSLFESTKSAVLLINKESTIIAANARCCEIFGTPQEEMKGLQCTSLIAEGMEGILDSLLQNIEEDQPNSVELTGKRIDGELMPLDITAKRIDLDHRALFLLVIRDMSLQNKLKEELRKEKVQVEEMSVALKKVMKTVDQEQKSLKDELAKQIKSELLPAVERMAKEPSREVREGYMTLIQDQLTELTTGSSGELDKHLLRLTPTELQVCRYIQANKSSKEIADLMNSSFETIQTHRKNIRDKLGLKGKNITLYMFLKSKKYSSQ